MSLRDQRPGRVAAGLAAAALLGSSAFAPPAGAAEGGPVPPDSVRTVTLITGDRVTMGASTLRVEGPQGAAVGYTRRTENGSTYIYPDEALPYVAKGLLDKRLFDVSGLIADGYDDARTSRLPLIIKYAEGATSRAKRAAPAGGTVTHVLESIDGAAVTRDRAAAVPFWNALTGDNATAKLSAGAPVEHVWLDGKMHGDLAESTAQIGAPRLWSEGDEGKGVDVAVLDSGLDTGHPDFAGQVTSSSSFVPDEDVTDYFGHGTHVASTIAGTGAASGGAERGVAPGARLHIGKVLDRNNSGQESWIIAGMEWAARDQHSRVINMSLGYQGGDATDPVSTAVNTLSAETGALFVIAAGNSGPAAIGSPGNADSALTVGAVDASDHLASFSSQGPRNVDAGIKPEITAPGVDILAARSQFSPGEGSYITQSGTSMATPHVTGAAALVAAAHPDWSGQRIKQALVGSAKATPDYTPYQAGAGRVDAYAAAHTSVFATVTAYSGFYTWGTEPATKTETITYSNDGEAPVTLRLALDIDAPAGTFTLDRDTVTVPAKGTTTATMTVKPPLVPVDSKLNGMLVASDASGVVRTRTLIGAGREGERHDLTVIVKDRDGKPAAGRYVQYLDRTGASGFLELDSEGRTTVRLPVSSYSGFSQIDVRGAHGPRSKGFAMLAFNDVKLDRDRTVVLDARQARPVTAQVPQETTVAEMRIDLYRGWPGNFLQTSSLPDATYDSVWALPTGRKVTDGEFELGARARLEQPALTVAGRDVLVKRATPALPEGRYTLQVSTAPKRGAAHIVRNTGDIAGQAAVAAKAGVKVLLVVNDGAGRLDPWPAESRFGPDVPAPVTVATLGADEGEALLAAAQRRTTTIRVTSHPRTTYLYDVVHHWTGAVPADPAFRSGSADLARVNVAFRHDRPAKALESRTDLWRGVWTGMNPTPAPAQGTRTDWVTAGTAWRDEATLPGEMVQKVIDPSTYRAGHTGETTWFGPILRPRMGQPDFLPTREQDAMHVPVPGWGANGAGYIGQSVYNLDVANYAELYLGDEVVGQDNFEYMNAYGLPAGPQRYRVVADNDRGDWAATYSTHTRTEWAFTSAAGSATLPLIQLDYAVPLDEAGRAARNAEVTVTPRQLPGVTATVGRPQVEVSYDDGRIWHPGGSLKAPRSAAFVSLRVSARDNAGNTVRQEITRAFGLR
ncbi:peptidase [Paractinoplanes deccanensis]|uniref:Peptidase n=1 Tax=Paractinoplanes deccanensis TaxID=113561 RepID=A0ABQ3YM15_9ACTN|nr:S8 family serine peptidase [Actinoplanes deccanensis]GID81026.1 peptidase [Actinoplanes deccanensis]